MESQTEMRYRFVRGHGSDIFLGCLSLFFATVASYYFFANNDNELRARQLRDQNQILSEEKTNLKRQVEELQASAEDVKLMLEARNKAIQQQQADLESLTRRATNLSAAQNIINQRSELQRDIATRLRRAIRDFKDVDFITVVNRNNGWALRIENSVIYIPGELKLTPEAESILARLAEQMKPLLETHEIRLEAYTDSDPITGAMKKRFASNTELAAARAEVVARFLEEQAGIDADRIAVVARGERQPVLPNTSGENKAKNRRLEISLQSSPPGGSEATAADPSAEEKPAG
ncbi:MAG: OmpA family protein [Verrucomicrobiota bacterium]